MPWMETGDIFITCKRFHRHTAALAPSVVELPAMITTASRYNLPPCVKLLIPDNLLLEWYFQLLSIAPRKAEGYDVMLILKLHLGGSAWQPTSL